MSGAFFVVVFIVVFYFVFRIIWRNVTTVSYNGLSGFIASWWSQILWAFFITVIITAIIKSIFEGIGNFFSGRGGDILECVLLIGGCYLIDVISGSNNDLFDKKTFRENYNCNIIELNQKFKLCDDLITHVTNENPGELVNVADNREVQPLSLAEEFVSNGNSTLTQFPNMRINHTVTDKTCINLSLKHVTCDNEMGRASIAFMEHRIAEITFTAAIEAVAKDKSRIIENALNLINDHGAFSFLSYGDESKREYSTDGVHYIVSKSKDCVSLKMIKIPSDDK